MDILRKQEEDSIVVSFEEESKPGPTSAHPSYLEETDFASVGVKENMEEDDGLRSIETTRDNSGITTVQDLAYSCLPVDHDPDFDLEGSGRGFSTKHTLGLGQGPVAAFSAGHSFQKDGRNPEQFQDEGALQKNCPVLLKNTQEAGADD